jgi:hypothetical protein
MAGDTTAAQRLRRIIWRAWWIVAAFTPGVVVVVIAVKLLSHAARHVLASD